MAKNIVSMVEKANPNRDLLKLPRRILKLGEEAGELNQAYLHVSSKYNNKKKTWNDVREEAVDAIIVALDVALTKFPTDKDKTAKEIREEVIEWLEKKLAKWNDNIISQRAATENIDDSI